MIEKDRFKNKIKKNAEKFLKTLFTSIEIEYCKSGSNINSQARCFAGRFAAKEAFLKALGTGLRNGIKWTEIEIINDPLGKPLINVSGQAEDKIQEREIRQIHLSISHDRDNAAAMVILEK